MRFKVLKEDYQTHTHSSKDHLNCDSVSDKTNVGADLKPCIVTVKD